MKTAQSARPKLIIAGEAAKRSFPNSNFGAEAVKATENFPETKAVSAAVREGYYTAPAPNSNTSNHGKAPSFADFFTKKEGESSKLPFLLRYFLFFSKALLTKGFQYEMLRFQNENYQKRQGLHYVQIAKLLEIFN